MGVDYDYCNYCECVYYEEYVRAGCIGCNTLICENCYEKNLETFKYFNDDDNDNITYCPNCKERELNENRINLLEKIKKYLELEEELKKLKDTINNLLK